jgi:hypothetical protein
VDHGENREESRTVKLSRRKCPKCGAELTSDKIVPVGPFPCPRCKALLQVSEKFFPLMIWAFVALAVLVAYLIGVRGLRLAAIGVFVFSPIAFIVVNYLKYFITPALEPYLPKTSTLDLRK